MAALWTLRDSLEESEVPMVDGMIDDIDLILETASTQVSMPTNVHIMEE